MEKKLTNYLTALSISVVILLGSTLFLLIDKLIQKDTVSLYNETILKTVEIRVSDDELNWGYATGFFIDNKGTILTNKHVVYNSGSSNNYNYIEARLATSTDYIKAEILELSNDCDLATIKINDVNTKSFKISDTLKNGEPIYTIGNPNGFGLSFTSGVVSSANRTVTYNSNTVKAVQTSFVINEGNSGGPVFNINGEIVGIISFRLKDGKGDIIQGISFAVPSKDILEFLK